MTLIIFSKSKALSLSRFYYNTIRFQMSILVLLDNFRPPPPPPLLNLFSDPCSDLLGKRPRFVILFSVNWSQWSGDTRGESVGGGGGEGEGAGRFGKKIQFSKARKKINKLYIMHHVSTGQMISAVLIRGGFSFFSLTTEIYQPLSPESQMVHA